MRGSAFDRIAELASATDALMVMALDQHGTLELTLDEWQALIDQLKEQQ